MPLHDWSALGGWEGFHTLWNVELLKWIKPRLPAEYRAVIGSARTLAVGAGDEKPDVAVRSWDRPDDSPDGNRGDPYEPEPDEEVATTTLDPEQSLLVTTRGRLVAAVELVSPRNKDRPAARAGYLAGYLGYLLEGANLVLVDVQPRPAGFSFADGLAGELKLKQAPLPTPHAVAYRVGEPAPEGGRFLAVWRRPLAVGRPLPNLPLPLTVHAAVEIDLEATYARAAADAYL